VTDRGVRIRTPLLLLLLCAAALPSGAQTPVPPEPWSDVLSVEIWSIADRIIHGDTPVEERLLREAQFTISGMIYGFDFVYTPEYRARGVERSFELSPVTGIPWGDPRLVIREIHDDRTTLYGLIDYTLSAADHSRVRSWQQIDVERATGTGSAPLRAGLDGKIRAIEEALHSAVRSHLQGLYQNRPREVTGTVVLREAPRIRTVSGTYEARVRIFIHVTEVRKYRIF
jgi:hypothetical protein